MPPRLRHAARALLRIGWDLSRSVLRPVVIEHELDDADRPHHHLLIRPGEAVAVPAAAEREPLVLVAWNIHRNYHPEAIADSLHALVRTEQPHLLLLQEVPGAAEALWTSRPLAALLAGWHLAYAPVHRVRRISPYYPFAHAGLLTASRRPVAATAVLELPTVTVPKLGPDHTIKRIALYTRVAWSGVTVGVWNLHLENTSPPLGRWRQVERVLEAVAERHDDIAVLMGDFNTLLGRRERLMVELAARGWSRPPLDRRRRLLPRVDHAFTRGPVLASGRALPHPGSDHRPILLRLE